MKKYETLKIEVAMLDRTDVIATSGVWMPETTEGGAIVLPPMDIEDE